MWPPRIFHPWLWLDSEWAGTVRHVSSPFGAEPRSGEQIGLRPDAKAVKAVLTGDLNREPFAEETLRLVENLIRFLQKEC